MSDCTCGHNELDANFHMTPCLIKVRHLAAMRAIRRACLVHAEPDVTHCPGCAADAKAAG